MKKNWKLILKLFTSTFYLSAFTFGGGYVIVSLMRKKFVEDLKWIEENEMLDLTAISQSAPGPIAINASILVGYRIFGVFGSFVTVLGAVLPPLIVLSVISAFYTAVKDNAAVNALLKGMEAGICALIIDVVYSMGKNVFRKNERKRNFISASIMIGAFTATQFFNINLFYIIITCGLIGVISSYYLDRSEKEQNKP